MNTNKHRERDIMIKAILLAPYYLCSNLYRLWVLHKLEKKLQQLKKEQVELKEENNRLKNRLNQCNQ